MTDEERQQLEHARDLACQSLETRAYHMLRGFGATREPRVYCGNDDFSVSNGPWRERDD